MSMRKIVFANDHYYHIFNRGVAKQPIFDDKKDLQQFILATNYYRFTKPNLKLSSYKKLSLENRQKYLLEMQSKQNKLIEIVSYALMPNHFHFLLRQNIDNGISKFISQLSNSYTKHYNIRHDRVGPLLQGVFKAVKIEDERQLLQVSRYIHLNPLSSLIVNEKELLSYQWSSFKDYLASNSYLIDRKPILEYFDTTSSYKKFVLEYADYAKELEKIKHLVLEEID